MHSHQRWSIKKYVLNNFAKFKGKHLRRSLCFNKPAGKNTFFIKNLRVTASACRNLKKKIKLHVFQYHWHDHEAVNETYCGHV